MSETIWVMEQDCCDYCNALLDYFGQCPHGCDLIEENTAWDEEEDDDYDGWESDWDIPLEEVNTP